MQVTVGCRVLEVADAVQGAAIPLAILYPSRGEPAELTFAPYTVEAALDTPPSGTRLPLVVISHGDGGSPWVHRDLARHLVEHGFVVALPEHPGNSRSGNELAGTTANLENRPRHLRLVADAVFGDEVIRDVAAKDRYGIIGMSIGGFTALALAGGAPWTAREATNNHGPRPLEVAHDPRVRAIALLAPATPWFLMEGSLSKVVIPILMKTGDRDEVTPEWHAQLVRERVSDPSLVDHEIIPGAGHFSFMSAFPPTMARPDFPPSQDPPGFDRLAYQPILHRDVQHFFERTLRSYG